MASLRNYTVPTSHDFNEGWRKDIMSTRKVCVTMAEKQHLLILWSGIKDLARVPDFS